jgi:hypothetical protein
MQVLANTRQVGHVKCSADHLDPTGGQAREIKFAAVNIAAGAQTEVIAAVGGKKIRVLAAHLAADQDGTFAFCEGSTPDYLSGIFPIGLETAGDPAWRVESEYGIVQTSAGEGLDIITVTCTIDGILVYIEV